MKSFRDGNHKVIICTPDSAGEGIDVSGCNFVINYDYLKTEVGMIQIKGETCCSPLIMPYQLVINFSNLITSSSALFLPELFK